MTEPRRIRLLNPGPVTLTERVRRAQLGPDLCHREPEFTELQQEVRRGLESIYEDARDDYTAVLLTGSGTAAVEAMVSSLVPRDGKALVAANGIYGERIAAMLQAHGKRFEVVQSAWTEPMNLAEVERRLTANSGITHVLAVHHETTTGRLNDLKSLGGLCRRRRVALLLDTVSSFGGERIDFRGWNIEACAATANKCLHGVPGIAFVLVRRDALKSRGSGANTLYLDLFRHADAQDRGSTLFTPAVQSLYALREALRELHQEGGWRRRHERYRKLSAMLRRDLLQAGFRLLIDEAACSCILTAFDLPPGLAFDDLYAPLKEAGFVIYPGQKTLESKIFRIAVMGDLTPADIAEFTVALTTLAATAPQKDLRRKPVLSPEGDRS